MNYIFIETNVTHISVSLLNIKAQERTEVKNRMFGIRMAAVVAIYRW
jgi:hypothetical protein